MLFEAIFSRIFGEDHLPWYWITIIVAISVLPAVTATMLYFRFMQKTLQKHRRQIAAEFGGMAERLGDRLSELSSRLSQTSLDVTRMVERGLSERELNVGAYICDTGEISKLENSAQEIWVITSDFYWDVVHATYSELVQKNIKLGKSYTYFCPDKPRSREQISEILSRIPPSRSVTVVYVPQDNFGIAHHFEFVIYDPNDDIQRKGILVDLLGTKTKNSYNSIDLYLDDTHVVSKILRRLEQWKANFPPLVFKGQNTLPYVAD